MYLLCINDEVKDYRETGLFGSLAVLLELLSSGKEFMISSLAWRVSSRKSISLLQQSHFLALKNKVLEKLEKYNKDVKYGYANPSPSKDHAELLRYYE
ncbi:hypothetical protein Tco_0943242 [Tanacetum coccineum]